MCGMMGVRLLLNADKRIFGLGTDQKLAILMMVMAVEGQKSVARTRRGQSKIIP